MSRHAALCVLGFSAALAWPGAPIKVLLVTGGHEYDTASFESMWAGVPGIQRTVRSLRVGTEIFEDVSGFDYDVLVLYNKHNPGNTMTARHQQNFIALMKKGVGLFCLHHGCNSYPFWPEFKQIIGVEYRSPSYFSSNVATYGFPGRIPMNVLDTAHPVTRGLPRSFTYDDEIYGNLNYPAGNHALLSTPHPSANGPMAWMRSYENARVFTSLLGHGPGSFDNPDFRRMLGQAIVAVAPSGTFLAAPRPGRLRVGGVGDGNVLTLWDARGVCRMRRVLSGDGPQSIDASRLPAGWYGAGF